MKRTRICSVADCGNQCHARGLCIKHYRRGQRSGDLPPRVEYPDFWGRVNKTSTCWLWTGFIAPTGYGQLAGHGTTLRAHRVAYEQVVGPIPEGLVLDHICRVRHCVNPDHLRAVTNRENTLAGIGPSALNARKMECKHGHDLTDPASSYVDGRGWRVCRVCQSKKTRAYQDRPARCPDCGRSMRRGSLTAHRSKNCSAAEVPW